MSEETKNYKTLIILIISMLAVVVVVLIFAKARNMNINAAEQDVSGMDVATASAQEPLTLAAERVIGKSRDTLYQKTNIYNRFADASITPTMDCTGGDFTAKVDSKTIKSGESMEFLIRIDTGRSPSGEYVCSISVDGMDISAMDFIIRII